MKIKFELENLDGLVDNLEDIIIDAVRPGIEKGCALVERKAKELAPKDTGALRRSITSEVVQNGEEVYGIVYTPLEYAPYVEYGTGLWAEEGNGRKDVPWAYQDDKGEWHSTMGQHPQPFMRPALNQSREDILRLIARELSNG